MKKLAVLAVLGLTVAAPFAAADDGSKPPVPPAPAAPAEPQLAIEVVAKGEGREVKPDDAVLAHIVVSLPGGKVLADTRKDGEPQALVAGSSALVALDKALLQMRVGDHWKIDAPWELAFGEKGRPPAVPPKTNLK